MKTIRTYIFVLVPILLESDRRPYFQRRVVVR
jgi:hypothetical protein